MKKASAGRVFRDKGEARAWAKAAGGATGEESAAIQKRLLAQEWFWMTTPLGCYRAASGEVGTDKIWRAAEERGWETAAPAGVGDGYVWRSAGGAWKAGAHGIEEPEGGEEISAGALRAVVVPGLAFDAAGTRLGHGKGHFDRLLAGAEGVLKIGLCPESRLAGELPREAHDAAVDVVVTERRTLYAPGAEERLARWFGGR